MTATRPAKKAVPPAHVVPVPGDPTTAAWVIISSLRDATVYATRPNLALPLQARLDVDGLTLPPDQDEYALTAVIAEALTDPAFLDAMLRGRRDKLSESLATLNRHGLRGRLPEVAAELGHARLWLAITRERDLDTRATALAMLDAGYDGTLTHLMRAARAAAAPA